MTTRALTIASGLRKASGANRLEATPSGMSARTAGVRMRAMSDLNTRFAEGDPEALRAVYREYGRAVFSVAYRVLQDRTLAEDATQHTFLNAWRGADRFDPVRELAPWLFTIAKRVAIDVYRKEKRHRSETLDDRDIAVLPDSFEAAWATWEVRRALDALPEDERIVLEAMYFLGLTHEEAAVRLDVPLGTIKSRSHRAYRRLARLLAHLDEEASA
ncbi:MAG: RNA polymerase sigma factor [Acidimicrobiia bacterium]|nr:RNA polymerase sigma factor [Acidimicrobiia bacterium]